MIVFTFMMMLVQCNGFGQKDEAMQCTGNNDRDLRTWSKTMLEMKKVVVSCQDIFLWRKQRMAAAYTL